MNEKDPEITSSEPKAPHPDGAVKAAGSRLFRRPGRTANIAALLTAIGLFGVLALLLIFHWPHANASVYYFATRPGFVWFGMLLPLFAPGLLYLRPRWLVVVGIVWLLALCACDDGYKIVRPWAGRQRESFEAAQGAYRSFMASDGPKDTSRLEIPLRVLTWNVRNGTLGARELAAEIAAQRADLVVMQEFTWGSDETMRQAVLETPELLGYEFKPDVKFALLSRFPLEKVKSSFLPEYNHAIWDVEVSPGHKLRCIIVHLPPQEMKTQVVRGWTVAGLRNAVQSVDRTLAALKSAIDAAPRPVMVLGDFNLAHEYPQLKNIMSDLKECFSDEGYGWGKTAPAKLPAIRVDMIYVPENAQVVYSAAIPTIHSDHYGMLAEFFLPPFAPTVRQD